MNWDMVGALGEMGGATAVVLSLVYLARQVRMSNSLGRAEAWRAAYDSLTTLNAGFGADPVFRQALHRVLYEYVDRDDLTPDERISMGMYLASVLNIYSQLFQEMQEGILVEKSVDFLNLRMFSTPFFESSWPLYRQDLDKGFVAYLEGKLGLEAQASLPGG